MEPQKCNTTVAAPKVRAERGTLRIRNWQHVWGSQTLLMGIVNVTPDSFSGDGISNSVGAVNRALEQIEQGAAIVDVGGESTRPGFDPISETEEIRRVVPVIAALRQARADAIISIDTTKAAVLEQAMAAGADILNSIWGLKEEFVELVAQHKLPIVIMHNQEKPVYDSAGVVEAVLRFLSAHAEKAVRAGLEPEQIILDPGIGFGKLAEHNLAVLNKLDRLPALGFPTLLGASRKSFIGKLTGQPVENRVFGTAAAVALAVASGIDIVRVHDVVEMKEVVQVSDAIVRASANENGKQ